MPKLRLSSGLFFEMKRSAVNGGKTQRFDGGAVCRRRVADVFFKAVAGVLMQSSQPQRVVEPVLSPKDFKEIAAAIDAIYVSPAIARYVSQIVRATRSHASARYGASPRAGVMMVRAARGRAFLEKRDYVCPDDVAQIACYALNHRIETVSPSASADDVISDVLAQVAFE